MTVGEAKRVARAWVARSGARLDGYRGAYLAGSTCWLPEDAALTPGTDTDVMVVVDEATAKPGKFLCQGVLLEASLVPWARVRSPETVLSDYHLAPSFQGGTILDDPTGELARVQACVRREYPRRAWVERRLDMVEARILDGLDALDPKAPFHMQVMGWVFPTGVTAHLILVAALRNPTVRKRYVAAKDVLAEYGLAERYPSLLRLLGCDTMPAATVQRHLDALAGLFDATAAIISPGSSLPWASDLHPESRPIAIDGSQRLIYEGLHREAVFWLVVTWTRCLSALAEDAPAQLPRWSPGFHDLMGELGIASFDDILARGQVVMASLPGLRALADQIVARNTAIITTQAPAPAGQPGRSV